MDGCAPFDAASGYAMALTRYIDCQAALLGEGGYAALSASNSPVILALGGLLTILIAFQGYRLLLGEQPHIRDGVLLIAKIGLVLAFASQWSAYRSVVYNLAIEAPQDVRALLPGAGGGAVRGFPARLQTSYQAIAELTRPSDRAPEVNGPSSGEASATGPAVPQNLPFSLVGHPLLITAGIMLLVSGLAVLISIRLLGGLLLALGPLFFACLLFDTTRGLFEGWVRGLLGTAIASVMTGALLGIEMSIVEPQLEALIDAMAAGTLPVMAPGEILATVLIFTLALLIALIVALRIGAGFRFLDRIAVVRSQLSERRHTAVSAPMPEARFAPIPIATQDEVRSRATMIADAIRISTQRDGYAAFAGKSPEMARRIDLSDNRVIGSRPTPLGQSQRRVTSLRKAKSMSQRNQS